MMRTRFTGAQLVDPASPLNGQIVDILVEGDTIANVTPTSNIKKNNAGIESLPGKSMPKPC